VRHRLAIVPALLLLVAVAAPVLAKGDVQARLDAPIPADAAPGTTLAVAWTTTQADGDGGTVAFSGAPVFIALTAPGATKAEALVFGDEHPAGSGHWTASIVVPRGGIAPDGVSIGLRGTSCEAGVCQRSDLLFELVGHVMVPAVAVEGDVVASPRAADPAGGEPVDPAASRAADAPPFPWLTLALGMGLAAVAVGLLTVRRRRGQPFATD